MLSKLIASYRVRLWPIFIFYVCVVVELASVSPLVAF